MPRPLLFVVPALLLVASCSDDSPAASSVATTAAPAITSTSGGDTTTTIATQATVADTTASSTPTSSSPATSPATTTPSVVDPTAPTSTSAPVAQCDPETARSCLLPWPNDALVVADEATGTGLRLAIPQDLVPRNVDGVPIDVTDQNRGDGFSPGSTILVEAPGVDLERSGVAPSTDIGASLNEDAPITITDTHTGEKWPYWAELDAQAIAAGDADPLLMIHPAVSLTEGHTYDVTVTGLIDANDAPVDVPVQQWTFTVASAESLSGRLLHMRNEAYAALADRPPTFAVTESVDDGAVRTVEGTIDVPLYLSGAGAPGSVMVLDDNGLPTHNPDVTTFPARFRCVLPLSPPEPVPTIVYGHGLLGSRAEVDALSFAAELGLAAVCGMDWIGMSTEDIGQVIANLADLSTFNTQADRMQQGLLNFQFLGRALNDERAFASHSAFSSVEGVPIVAPGETQFVGNSQGGILGAAASAISTEWKRAVLGVPGINYSLLLHRSIDWPQFQEVFDVAYPDPVGRVLALQVIQLLWDRGENNGYAQHVTSDPYSGIEPKEVLLIQAFGDHQVANVSTEILARTMNVPVHEPSLGEGRSNDVDPQWGIEPLAGNTGSALFVWDFGTPPPPPVNLPPTSPEYGDDPHGAGSEEQRVLALALGFLLTGELQDVCGADPCVSTVMTG